MIILSIKFEFGQILYLKKQNFGQKNLKKTQNFDQNSKKKRKKVGPSDERRTQLGLVLSREGAKGMASGSGKEPLNGMGKGNGA